MFYLLPEPLSSHWQRDILVHSSITEFYEWKPWTFESPLRTKCFILLPEHSVAIDNEIFYYAPVSPTFINEYSEPLVAVETEIFFLFQYYRCLDLFNKSSERSYWGRDILVYSSITDSYQWILWTFSSRWGRDILVYSSITDSYK